MKYNNEIIESLKFGLIDMFVLLLLQEEEMYGYKIRKEIEKRTNNVFKIKEGTLYGPLYRLNKRGLIANESKFIDNRYRNYYHIEDSGREFLQFILSNYEEITKSTQAFIEYSLNNQNKKID